MKIKDLIEELKRLYPEGKAYIKFKNNYGRLVTEKVLEVKSQRAGHDAVIVATLDKTSKPS